MLQPYGLLVQCGPLVAGKRAGVDMKRGPDQGAPLRDGLLVVIVRKGVRPYKFFTSVWQAANRLPSAPSAEVFRIASFWTSGLPPSQQFLNITSAPLSSSCRLTALTADMVSIDGRWK